MRQNPTNWPDKEVIVIRFVKEMMAPESALAQLDPHLLSLLL
jgi:hypothetical protein